MGLICLFSSAEDFSAREKGISYGLSFKSYEVTQDERTSLNLNPKCALKADKGFCVDFDVTIKPGFSFGYIFRFIDDRLNHLDFCSNHNASRFNFIFGDNEDVISNAEIDMADGCAPHHIKVEFKSDSCCFLCSVDSVSVSVPVRGSRLGKFQLLFGCIDNDRYFTTDLPRFTVRDVVLTNGNGKTVAEWPMSRHSENAVFDRLHNRKAIVRNGVWEIDNHSKWMRREVYNLPVSEAGITYSSDGSNVFVISDDVMRVYFTADGHTEVRKAGCGSMPRAAGGQLIYDGPDAILITATNSCPGAEIYNLSENSWQTMGDGQILPVSNHQGMFFRDSTHTAYLVGGYGMHKYYNGLYSYDFDGERCWNVADIDMTPRYLCAAGEYDGSILVAGGYGSRSGLQEEDPHNLYDILLINPDTFKCDTLSNMTRPEDCSQFVFSSSIVSDVAGDSFYSLIFDNEKFNSEAKLARVGALTGGVECFAEPLPFKFHDLSSSCQLFRGGRNMESLYAVLMQPQGDSGYEVSIYSMAFPPLHVSDILVKQRDFPWYLIFVFVAMVAAALAVFLLLRRNTGDIDLARLDTATNTIIVGKSFIRLLGGFQVIDAKGNDITGEFSPILKGLLSFIILRLGKDGKGVSNASLDNAFWTYMEHTKALNNRRVNLSKLRAILMKVGDVKLGSREGYVDFSLGPNVYCDYLSLMEALRLSKVSDIVAVGSLGPLLPDLSYDCLSEFKSDLTLRLSDFLLRLGKGRDRESLMTRVNLADVVLLQDSIDENAIAIKCRALYALGQKGLSKSAYDSFSSQYKSLLSSEPDSNYSDILKSE